MRERNIFITNPTKLSVRDNDLLLTTGVEEKSIPLEDISSIILDNKSILITASALEEIASREIVLLTNDEKTLPNGIFQGYGKHSRQLSLTKAQLNMSMSQKNNLWQEIIIKKLENQGKVLKLLGYSGSDYLPNLSKQVRSGDEGGLEAVGSKYYFQKLFGSNFTRKEKNIKNFALNYGYAIIRGRIASTLASYGYICSLGIHHNNEYNAFNLADDIIDSYKVVVELWVANNIDNLSEELSIENKISLLNLLNTDIELAGKKYSVELSINETIESFTQCVLGKRKNLSLPTVLSIRKQEKKYTYKNDCIF